MSLHGRAVTNRDIVDWKAQVQSGVKKMNAHHGQVVKQAYRNGIRYFVYIVEDTRCYAASSIAMDAAWYPARDFRFSQMVGE
jgi:hypothetical protein